MITNQDIIYNNYLTLLINFYIIQMLETMKQEALQLEPVLGSYKFPIYFL